MLVLKTIIAYLRILFNNKSGASQTSVELDATSKVEQLCDLHEYTEKMLDAPRGYFFQGPHATTKWETRYSAKF